MEKNLFINNKITFKRGFKCLTITLAIFAIPVLMTLFSF